MTRDQLVSKLGEELVVALELAVLAVATDTEGKLNDIMGVLEDLQARVATVEADDDKAISLLQAAAATAAEQTTMIASLNDQLSRGVSPASVQPLLDELQAHSTAFEASLSSVTPTPAPAPAPAPEPAPAPAPFVTKVDGETYADYQARVAAWNADPANAAAQVTELDEPTWTAAPVG
jgi:ABC-type transporter Mla subunit MlaD